MIQRIQSIYLFLAAAAAGAMFALPIATTAEAQADSAVFADAAFEVQDTMAMMIAFGLAAMLLLVIIFLYSNRTLQMNLTKAGLFVTGVGVGVGVYQFFNDEAADLAQPAAGIALPILVVVFSYLALRNIRKDEKLVRSVDRLR